MIIWNNSGNHNNIDLKIRHSNDKQFSIQTVKQGRKKVQQDLGIKLKVKERETVLTSALPRAAWWVISLSNLSSLNREISSLILSRFNSYKAINNYIKYRYFNTIFIVIKMYNATDTFITMWTDIKNNLNKKSVFFNK